MPHWYSTKNLDRYSTEYLDGQFNGDGGGNLKCGQGVCQTLMGGINMIVRDSVSRLPTLR